MAIVIVRTLIIYLALILTMRLLGKRQLGEMELSEFVLASLIADLASHPLQDVGIPIINGIVPIFILFCCEILIAGFTMKNVHLRSFLFGKPSMLIVRGKIMQDEMQNNRFTVDELMQELRGQGMTDISKIEYAILETNGKLNVIPFAAERPATPSQLGITTLDETYPVIVVSGGRILEKNLKYLGRDINWLRKQLKQRGAADSSEVFLMTSDRNDNIYFARKETGE